MNYFVRIAFLGKKYFGTQRQKDKLTIQGVFEEVLSKVFDEKILIKISSRLDKGVNALDFAFTFKTETCKLKPDYLKYYLSRTFQSDVFIKDVRIVNENFSARYDCLYKQYIYLIQDGAEFNPLLSEITYIPKRKLDFDKLYEIINLFNGTHEFKYFSSPEGDENTRLTMDCVEAKKQNNLIMISFKAKSFLRYQIRFMVGTAMLYEKGKISIDTIKNLLSGKNEKFPRLKAEPQGLFLQQIKYEEIDDISSIDMSPLF